MSKIDEARDETSVVEWLTVEEAKWLAPGGRMTGANLRRLLQDGKVKGQKVGGTWKVDKASVEAYAPGPTSSRGRRGGKGRHI